MSKQGKHFRQELLPVRAFRENIPWHSNFAHGFRAHLPLQSNTLRKYEIHNSPQIPFNIILSTRRQKARSCSCSAKTESSTGTLWRTNSSDEQLTNEVSSSRCIPIVIAEMLTEWDAFKNWWIKLRQREHFAYSFRPTIWKTEWLKNPDDI